MHIQPHRRYYKAWAKLTEPQQRLVAYALKLYVADTKHPKLRIHQLKGEYYPQYSISAGGDLRIHFLQVSDNHILLMDVGTHAQLYE